MSSLTLRCLDCEYSWKPRKAITLYKRQCPKCDSYRLEKIKNSSNAENTEHKEPGTTRDRATSSNMRWPKVVYDLMGITGARSPENALVRAFEFHRRALPYKFKYNVESPVEVFKLLENKIESESRKAAEAIERLQSILENPELVFYEIAGTTLTAVNYYETFQKKGYNKGFLEFLNEVVVEYLKILGYESPEELGTAIARARLDARADRP